MYRYEPRAHALLLVAEGDKRRKLAEAALRQSLIAVAPAIFVLAAVHERATAKYRERGWRYLHIEAGHAAQNICPQFPPLGLASCMAGAFDDAVVAHLPKLPYEQQPVAMVGYRATRGLTQFISRVAHQLADRCAAPSGDTGDLMAVRRMRSPTT